MHILKLFFKENFVKLVLFSFYSLISLVKYLLFPHQFDLIELFKFFV
jgi:hypothetical protein